MKFEEAFPELKDKYRSADDEQYYPSISEKREEWVDEKEDYYKKTFTIGTFENRNEFNEWSVVDLEDIEKHCLSKQRVKEAIDNVQMTDYRKKREWDRCINFIKEELGL